MSTVGVFHLVFCLVAITMGAVVLMLPKGTRWHRTWGHAYVWSMVGVVATSLSMFNLTGAVTPFHLAALVAAVTIGGGMWTVLMRRPKKDWIEAHATWMAWSYIGLIAAFIAETATRFAMPMLQDRVATDALWPAFWTLVALATVATFVVGVRLIRSKLPAAVQGTPAAMRLERDQLLRDASPGSSPW